MTKVLDGQVNGMLYGEERKGEEKQNFYKLHNNEYVYRALKHAPQLDFTPDPSTVDIPMANGFELNPTNRFILEACIQISGEVRSSGRNRLAAIQKIGILVLFLCA